MTQPPEPVNHTWPTLEAIGKAPDDYQPIRAQSLRRNDLLYVQERDNHGSGGQVVLYGVDSTPTYEVALMAHRGAMESALEPPRVTERCVVVATCRRVTRRGQVLLVPLRIETYASMLVYRPDE